MILKQETQNIVLAFVKKYFPLTKHLVLSGSYATNSQTENSDFDIIILDKSVDKIKNERIIYLSQEFDVKRIPLHKIDDILVLDLQNGHGLFTGMLAKGIIILDENDVAKSLISVCRKRFEVGFAAKDMNSLHRLKIQVQNDIEGLNEVVTFKEESYLKIMDLALKYVNFVLYFHGLWTGNNKVNYKQLEKIEPNFNNNLQKGVSKFFCEGSVSLLTKTIEKQMAKYGDQNTFNIPGPTLNYVNEDYFVMKIVDRKSDIFITMKKTVREMKEVLRLLDNPEKFWFFTPNSLIRGENRYNQMYVIIFQDQKSINKSLPAISKHLAKVSDNYTNLYGPVNIDISLVFNSCFQSLVFQQIVHKFCEKILTQKKFDHSKSLLISLEVSYFIASLIPKFREFNDYLFDCWFPASFDTGTHLNVNALLVLKKKKLIEFKKSFNRQAETLLDFSNHLKKGGSYFISSDLKEMIKAFYREENAKLIFHSFHLIGFNAGVSNTEKKNWYKMKTCLDSILGSLLIEENHKSYFPYVLNSLHNLN